MQNLKLSVVIPAYNEAKNLQKKVLEQVNDYLKRQEYNYEVLIVDDGSTDDTRLKVKNRIRAMKNFRLIEERHGGKAITVMKGIIASRGEIALFTDMDQATPLKEIENFFPKFKQGFDLVIGTRIGRKGAPFIRKLSAWGFSILRNLILGLPFKDTQCGFKAFNRKAIQAIFPDLLHDWQKIKISGAAVNAGFDVETLYLAKKKNFKIAQVAVEWHYVGTERVQLISDSLEAIKDMFRIRINDIRGRYS